MLMHDKVFKLNVDPYLLANQIDALCESDLPEDIKTGLHHLLGALYDQIEDRENITDKTEGVLYKHFKGNTYIVIGDGKHTETGEELVIYTSSALDGPFWCRPKEMFHGYTNDGVKRFTVMNDESE